MKFIQVTLALFVAGAIAAPITPDYIQPIDSLAEFTPTSDFDAQVDAVLRDTEQRGIGRLFGFGRRRGGRGRLSGGRGGGGGLFAGLGGAGADAGGAGGGLFSGGRLGGGRRGRRGGGLRGLLGGAAA